MSELSPTSPPPSPVRSEKPRFVDVFDIENPLHWRAALFAYDSWPGMAKVAPPEVREFLDTVDIETPEFPFGGLALKQKVFAVMAGKVIDSSILEADVARGHKTTESYGSRNRPKHVFNSEKEWNLKEDRPSKRARV